jgi:tripartite-type tricarboxylate transporter receptor subunit TctC
MMQFWEGIMEKKRLTAFALFAALALPAHLWAQNYPVKPVRVVVPFPPGGGTDVQARVIVKEFQDQLRQTFIIDNRGGASGMIGAELVVNSPADGYTLLFTTATLAINTTLYGNRMKFHPLKNLAPVSFVSTTPMVLIVHPSVPATTAKEMIELTRKKPDFLNAAINVPGSTSHLSAEMFKQLAGVRFTTVPYQGGGPSMVAVMGGQVDFQIAEGILAAPQLKAGRIRALAVTTPEPSPFFPGLPTMTSLLPGFVSDNWFAMYFPAGTSKEIVSTMNATIRKALATETVRAFAQREVLTLVGSSPEELGAFLKSEIARYGEVIRKGNITVQ